MESEIPLLFLQIAMEAQFDIEVNGDGNICGVAMRDPSRMFIFIRGVKKETALLPLCAHPPKIGPGLNSP